VKEGSTTTSSIAQNAFVPLSHSRTCLTMLAPGTSGRSASVGEWVVACWPQPASPMTSAPAASPTVRDLMGWSASVAELPGWARRLLDTSPVARLGLLDGDGSPRVMPVVFAVCDGMLVSAVDDKPKRRPGEELARVRWLRARPQAALTVDHYEDDWSRLAWVQALGPVRVAEAAEAPAAIAALCARYSQYRERAPGGPVLALAPERLLWWRAAGA